MPPPEHARQPPPRVSRADQRAAAREAAGRPPKRRSIIWRSRRLFLLVFVVFVTGCSGFAYAMWEGVELPPSTPPLKQTTFLCSGEVQTDCNEHNSIAQLSADEDRVTVAYDQIPPVLVQAVVSTEDKEFFEHKGVDPAGVTRAFLSQLRDEPLKQGGSTITQQYVKNTYLSSDQTLDRKLKEAVLSIKLERELSKTDILERYLNTIYFGRGAYGVQAAARLYFGKDVQQLGLPEAAYLAGIIRAPEAADANRPSTDPQAASGRKAAETRRHDVLRQMKDLNYISQAQFDAVDKMGWDYVVPRTKTNSFGNVAHTELGSEYYIEYVRRLLTDPNGPYKFTDAQLFEGGLRIYTTIDWNMQKMAYDTIASTMNLPTDPAASIVAVDTSGYAKVMVGGMDFKKSQVNLAVGADGGGSGRQPGSSFKPIALAQAIAQGVPLNTTYNAPGVTTLKLKDGDSWRVSNYGDAGLGQLDLLDMTRQSSNTAYAQLIDQIGVKPVTTLASAMGIKSKLPEVPSVVLGTGEVSPLEMASAYSTFMDNGEHIEPIVISRVENSRGQVVYQSPNERKRVLDPNVTQATNWILNQVVDTGTGTAAKIGLPVAGKTGTTENYRDAWFVGFTCQLTAAVWVGYAGPETKYMDNVHGKQVAGGTFPSEMFSKFMSKATQGQQCGPFVPPLAALTLAPKGPVVPFPNFNGTTPPSTASKAPIGPTSTTPPTSKPTTPSVTAAPTSKPAPPTVTTAPPVITTAPPPVTTPPPATP